MASLTCNRTARLIQFRLRSCLLLSALLAISAAAKPVLVPKWGRFEQSFTSSVRYNNPLQQCQLKVTFVSPHGDSTSVFGFWDGGKTWRVRFSPDQPGRWTYRTECSDSANKRLNNQTNEFLCTSILGQSRFAQHGPVQVSNDHRHFEHADGSPFFWLADAAWNAPALAAPRDWMTYTQVRSGQEFSAVEWTAAPGTDGQKRSAFTGKNTISINPEYYQRLDEKVDLMNRAGLLSVIAPLWENDDPASELSEDQAVLLIRYMVARWGAYDVAWLLTANSDRTARWQRIGREVFGGMRHAPVIVFPGALAAGFDDFRNENWADAFGFGLGRNVDDDSTKWLVAGPILREWQNQPPRPLLDVFPPPENAVNPATKQRIMADDSRRFAWWSLLLAPPAGASYGAWDVANWNTARQSKLPLWQLSLFLPGAKQMANISDFFGSNDCFGLRPAWRNVAVQPGHVSPRHYIAAAETESKDLQLTYVPEDRTLELYMEALSPSPSIQWMNPRTGQKSPAVAVVGARTCQLPTPETGDWLLIMKSGK